MLKNIRKIGNKKNNDMSNNLLKQNLITKGQKCFKTKIIYV